MAANIVGPARGRAALAPGVFADMIFIGQLDLTLLDGVKHGFSGHQRHHAGGRPQLICVLFEQDAAATGFDQDRGRRVAVETALVFLGALHAVVGGVHHTTAPDSNRDKGCDQAAPGAS